MCTSTMRKMKKSRRRAYTWIQCCSQPDGHHDGPCLKHSKQKRAKGEGEKNDVRKRQWEILKSWYHQERTLEEDKHNGVAVNE